MKVARLPPGIQLGVVLHIKGKGLPDFSTVFMVNCIYALKCLWNGFVQGELYERLDSSDIQ
jgi:hypothetical protein